MTDVFDGAEWLRDPVFEGVPVLNVFHKEKAEKPRLRGPKNVHTYFRKEVALDGEPSKAMLHITGDDYFVFYINGQRVVQGPEPTYPFAHGYYTLDVSQYLREGVNCLAAHAYYQGLVNRVWNSGDNRSGFMCALDVTPGGGAARFVTDATWRCLRSEAFPAKGTIGYKTQFIENLDMRLVPLGWRETGFDDSDWDTPLTGRQDHVFVPHPTPPLEVWRAKPRQVVKKGDGHYFYDFGTEIVGHTRIRVKGAAGHQLDVRHGEELDAPNTVMHDMRCGVEYREFPVLSGRGDTIEFYDYRAFRYMEILDAPSEPEVWVDVRHHPFDPRASRLTCSDPLLVDIWELCKNGARYGAQGGFLDCPTREKGQYLGDTLIAGHSQLTLTGDGSLVRKALLDFHQSQRICPGIMAVAPGSFMQEIAEYSLQWPIMLRHYYWATGDRAFAAEMAAAAFEPLFDYFAAFEGDHGLVTGMTEKWVLVDWPKNLRDGYDYEYAETRENAVLNAFYYASLNAAAGLLEDLGKDASAYRAKAEKVKAAYVDRLLNPATGLFVDAPGSSHSALHANAIPLAFGLAPKDSVEPILELIRQKRLSCGVYIAPFVIEACYEAGDADLGYSLITSRDEHSWHEMLKHGATTCMEVWGPEQKWNTSWCHAWSSSPVYLIAERVVGLTPAEPGWTRVRFAPEVPASLTRLDFVQPTPAGRVRVQYDAASGFVVSVPEGIAVDAKAPEGVEVDVREMAGGLTERQRAILEEAGWPERVGDGTGVWVSVPEQVFRVLEDGRVVWEGVCSTAEKGTGSEADSHKTPLGWHTIAEKIGGDAKWGQVFRSKAPTNEQWLPGQDTTEDLVLTRILSLRGAEPGKNQGPGIDSFERCIYIHGANDEERLGSPVSHGCVRLGNDDVIEVFGKLSPNTPVLITE